MITLYSKSNCPFCVRAKTYLENNNISFEVVDIEQNIHAKDFIISEGHRTVPQLYVKDKLLVEGGYTGLVKLSKQQILERMGT